MTEPPPAAGRPRPKPNPTFRRFRAHLRELYHGQSPRSVRFRLAVIALDFAVIGFFIVAPIIRGTAFFLVLDYFVAVLLAMDLSARALTWGSFRAWIRRPIVWIDIFVLLTL